jgi:hypothetical protein
MADMTLLVDHDPFLRFCRDRSRISAELLRFPKNLHGQECTNFSKSQV